jgi:hypothetical protein
VTFEECEEKELARQGGHCWAGDRCVLCGCSYDEFLDGSRAWRRAFDEVRELPDAEGRSR